MRKKLYMALLSTVILNAQSVDDDMSGFGDDEPISESNITSTINEKKPFIKGLTGEITQSLAYRVDNKTPHDDISSFKSSLFLDKDKSFTKLLSILIVSIGNF